MPLTIYHNPRCSKSRQTLELIRQAGVDPTIVLYLEEPTADDLPDTEDDAALAAWIANHPKVLERPIVVDDERRAAVVGRPPDNVQVLLAK